MPPSHDDLTVIDLPGGGVRIVLPWWPITPGQRRLFLLAGALGLAVCVGLLVFVLLLPPSIPVLGIALTFLLCFLVLLMGFLLLLWADQVPATEIDLVGGTVEVRQRFTTLSQSASLASAAALVLDEGYSNADASLTLVTEDTPLVLASGFPAARLQRLAGVLQEHCNLPLVRNDACADGAGLTPVADALVSLEADRMTLRLPPPGFLHVHPAWLFVAAVFFAIASVLSIGMFQIPAGGMALNQNTLLAAGGVAVVAVLGVAGVWFLRLACHLAWTQTEVRLDNHRLEVVLTGLAERHYSWSRARILGVTVQPEAPPRKKGQWPVLHVAVNLENGRAFPLLTGRPEEELRWVVRMLREGLERIPATDERSLETLIAARPPESRAVLESVVGVVTLELPPPGWQSTSVLVTTTGVVFLASAGFWGWLLARTPGPWLGGWWAQPLGAAAAGVFGLAALLEVALARWRDHLRVTISDDELVWHQPGWFRTTVYRWQRSEIAAIDVVHESLTDRHFYFLPELVIRFRSGRKKKLLLYHPGEEISWVVEILRHFLLRTAIRSS